MTIDDRLLELAKARARERDATLGEIVEDSLRRYLAQPVPVAEVRLPVFEGGTGLAAGIDPSSNASIADAADDDVTPRLDLRR
ncbi:antitoxin [Mumia flava]|uniref:antitoxin n=1 Tax=Mumia flava TaxID=1348852 RepID=UPI0012FDC45A|nr:antitoxin [Mumia flava]